MKIIFSPSKSQSQILQTVHFSKKSVPKFAKKADILYKKMRTLSRDEMQVIFKTSDKKTDELLTLINNKTLLALPSIEVFSGTSFKQLELGNYDLDQQNYLENNVLILSALYGLLRPFDRIKPYRLDMNDALLKDEQEYKNLYEFWYDDINSCFKKGEVIINLASKEYSQLLDNERLNVINFYFLTKGDNKEKSISVYSKQQRGALLDYIIKNKITRLKDLRNYSHQAYFYVPERSDENNYYFIKEI